MEEKNERGLIFSIIRGKLNHFCIINIVFKAFAVIVVKKQAAVINAHSKNL